MRRFAGVALVTGLAVMALVVVGSALSTAQDRPAGEQPAAAAGEARRGGPGGDQGGERPRFDPERMRTMMLERLKKTMDATDEEWKTIEPLASKVMEKQNAVRTAGLMGGFRMPGRPGAGGPGVGAPGAPAGGGPGMGTPDPEGEALSKALEAKDTPAKEIESKMKAVREARLKKEEELKKAREELRKVLTIRQEALLLLARILD